MDKHNYKYEQQYKNDECKSKRHLPFDFAVQLDGILALIEYQGEQHYEPVRTKGISIEKAKAKFFERLLHDRIKRDFCKKRKIPFLEISYWQFKEIDLILDHFLKQVTR